MDNSIQAKLKRLFSTQVIVRRIGKDRIKVIANIKRPAT